LHGQGGSANGNTVRQLGYKIVDGERSALFVFDLGRAQQQNLDTPESLGGNRLIVRFPQQALADMGLGARWKAVLNVDGADVDGCRLS
jgi:hypothetical protein